MLNGSCIFLKLIKLLALICWKLTSKLPLKDPDILTEYEFRHPPFLLNKLGFPASAFYLFILFFSPSLSLSLTLRCLMITHPIWASCLKPPRYSRRTCSCVFIFQILKFLESGSKGHGAICALSEPPPPPPPRTHVH